METWTQVVPWPEQPTQAALTAWRNDGAPYPATWAVTVTWAEPDDVWTPVGIDVRSFTTHGDGIRPTIGGLQPVTARQMRTVNVGEVVERARLRWIARHQRIGDLAHYLAVKREVEGGPGDTALYLLGAKADANVSKADEKQARQGRPATVTDEHLHTVAKVYNDAVATGSRSPVKAVAEHFGITDPHNFQPKGWVQAARKRGLIDKRGATHG